MSADLEQALTRVVRQAFVEALREVLPALATTRDKPDSQALPASVRLLRPREAAMALGISERQLWKLTNDGSIECVRINRLVRYDPLRLREFIDRGGIGHAVAVADGRPPLPTLEPNKVGSEVKKTSGTVVTVRRAKRRDRPKQAEPQPHVDKVSDRERPGVLPDYRQRDVTGLVAERLGVDRARIPPLTHGMIMRALEVDIATEHGWVFHRCELPAGAFERLVAWVAGLLYQQ